MARILPSRYGPCRATVLNVPASYLDDRGLTRSEITLLDRIADGQSTGDAGRAAGYNPGYARSIVLPRIRRRLGVTSTTAAVLEALRLGFIR